MLPYLYIPQCNLDDLVIHYKDLRIYKLSPTKKHTIHKQLELSYLHNEFILNY